MPTPKTYLVSFNPAERTATGFRTSLSLMAVSPRHEVTVVTLIELESAVRQLAADFGQTCSPYIRLKNPRDRKPPGFDALRHQLQVINFVPAPATTPTADTANAWPASTGA